MNDLANEQAKERLENLVNNEDVQSMLLRTDIEAIKYAISVLSENKGEWIYDKSIENWRCSKCGQTPPPTGYVGKADFMATHFKFCPNCGADMREPKPIGVFKCLNDSVTGEPIQDMREPKGEKEGE